MSRTALRAASVAAATASALIVTSVPASAGTSYFSRTTGVAATAEWVQYFDFPNPAFGNWHVGELYAYETAPGRADVFAFIQDYECEDGTRPQPDSHGGTPGCTFLGWRTLDGEGVAFTVAKRSASATLEGSLTARTADPHSEEGGTTLGQIPADFTWTAVGAATRSTSTYRYRGADGSSSSETFRSTTRAAEMTGLLGPMLFEEAASSSGTIAQFTSTSRSRS